MKHDFGWVLTCTLACALLAGPVRAEQTAVVKGNNVNVRGQATLNSEVITQLKDGERVTVIEEVSVDAPRKGAPARWTRIKLPVNTPVWVFAPYITLTDKTVRVNRLNIRAGPGEEYSVLGQLERGTGIREIRVVGNWMEIETPDTVHAFVASDYLVLQPTPEESPTTTTPESGTTAPAPETAATTPVVEEVTEIVAVVEETQPVDALDADSTNIVEIAVVEETMVEEPAPPRIVTREGVIIVTLSIQAPTVYALQSPETRRTINYLHSENLGIKLKNFGGRRVIVTGEELLDPRWTNTPILEVESLVLVP